MATQSEFRWIIYAVQDARRQIEPLPSLIGFGPVINTITSGIWDLLVVPESDGQRELKLRALDLVKAQMEDDRTRCLALLDLIEGYAQTEHDAHEIKIVRNKWDTPAPSND